MIMAGLGNEDSSHRGDASVNRSEEYNLKRKNGFVFQKCSVRENQFLSFFFWRRQQFATANLC